MDVDGSVSQGEASPLPGYSAESLDDSEAALSRVDWDALPDIEQDEPARDYLRRVHGAVPALPSSARFALETALLDRIGKRRSTPIWALLSQSTSAPRPVPVSAMAGSPGDPSALPLVRHALDRGVRTVKFKVRGPAFDAEREALAAVREALGTARLRLDVNTGFSSASVQSSLKALAEFAPELVEEPASRATLLSLPNSPVPLALDESLVDAGTLDTVAPRRAALRLAAVVLKPTTLGGFSGCLSLAESATALGLDVTVSHCFDGPVALRAAQHLALAVAGRTRASGLDVHGGLDAWPRVDLPGLGSAAIVPDDRPGLGLPTLEAS